jgi:hypothetical protein
MLLASQWEVVMERKAENDVEKVNGKGKKEI